MYVFASSDLKAGDNVAELHSKVDDRQKFTIVFGKATSLELTDLKYDVNLSQVLNLAPLVLKSLTLVNRTDASATQTSSFEYLFI